MKFAIASLAILFMTVMFLVNQNLGEKRENLRLYKKCLVENKTLTHEAATTLCSERVK